MLIFNLMISYGFIQPILSLLWCNSLFFNIKNLVLIIHGFSIVFYIVSFGIVVQYLMHNKLKNKQFFIFFILILSFDIVGLAVGLNNGYIDKIWNDFYTTLNGLVLSYAIILMPIKLCLIERFVHRFSFVVFFSLLISVFAMQVETFLHIPFYPAIASNFAFIPFLYFFFRKKYFLAFAVFMLILLSGKRSVFMIFVVTLPIVFMLYKQVSIRKIVFVSIIFSIFLLISFFGVLHILEKNIESIPVGKSAIAKFKYINPLSDDFNIRVAAGERVEEVFAALEANNANNFSFWIGSGNGFVYPLKVDRKHFYEPHRHNVHFSPITYYTRYGAIFTILFYTFLFYYIFCNIVIVRKKYSTNVQILVYYQLFAFLLSFISFSLSLDYLFWISFGIGVKLIQQDFDYTKV